MHNEKINELFVKKLNELILDEVNEVKEQLKNMNILTVEIKITNKKTYELINNTIGNSDNFVITATLSGDGSLNVNYFYKGKKIVAVSEDKDVAGTKISMYDLLTLAKYQDNNLVKLPSTLYGCTLHKCKSCDDTDLDELHSIMGCETTCYNCDFYEENEIGTK